MVEESFLDLDFEFFFVVVSAITTVTSPTLSNLCVVRGEVVALILVVVGFLVVVISFNKIPSIKSYFILSTDNAMLILFTLAFVLTSNATIYVPEPTFLEELKLLFAAKSLL